MGRFSVSLVRLSDRFCNALKPNTNLRRITLAVFHTLVILSMLLAGISPALAKATSSGNYSSVQDAVPEDNTGEGFADESPSESASGKSAGVNSKANITSWDRPETAEPIIYSQAELAAMRTEPMSAAEQAGFAASLLPLSGDLAAEGTPSLTLAASGPARPGETLYMAFQVGGVSDFTGLTLEVSVPRGFSWKGVTGSAGTGSGSSIIGVWLVR
jgi:hypothetical protein